jgi:DNA-binding NarL/FixJ family response regulator
MSAARSVPIRVLIADDHSVVREGLAAIIEAQPDMVLAGKGQDGHEAVDLWQRLKPDIGLFDLRMPGADAVHAIEAIRAADRDARIIILTTYDGDEDIYRALRSGAKGYILKDSSMEQITACVRAVHEGRSYLPPPVAAKLATRVGSDALTPRELEMLRLAAEGQTNKSIAARTGVSPATVKFHLNNAFSKLGATTRTAAIAIAVKRGLIRLS